MMTSRQRWLTRLIPFVGFSIVAAVASQADAAVTSCETNALTNANFEEATVDGKAAQWCDNWGRGYSRVLVTPAKYNYVPIVSIPLSVPAAERAAGAYQIVNLNQTQAKNVFVGAMVKGSNIVLDPDGLGATLNIGFKVDCAAYPRFCEYHGNPADNTLWCATLPSAGTFDWRWVGLDSHTCSIGYVDSATGNWIDVPIKSAAVFPIIRGATGTAYFDLVQLMEFPPGPGAVTFMFDDGYKSVKATAKPILDKYGFVGSAAAISSNAGSTGSLTPDDLRDLQAAGWDIASHSVTHSAMPGLSTAAAETELQKSKSTLTALGLTIDTFVWPYGDYNQSLIGLAQAGLPTGPLYKSARNTEFDDNAYGTFPYALKSLDVRETTPLQNVQAWINDLKAGGRWGILLLHDVVGNPGEYAITPTMLDQLAQLVASSGVAVINYRQGYQTFANIPVP
jgi:peptidoglycan/xylan/chitin deacetylase (PgdA/CDA1 family)